MLRFFSRGVQRIGCNDNGIEVDKGSNPRYIKSVTRSENVRGVMGM